MKNENWQLPTKESIKKSSMSFFKDEVDYSEDLELFKNAKTVRIPKSYFLSDKHFIPYTKDDLLDKNLESRVKKIVKGFMEGKTPMLLAIEGNGKPEVYDGFTRAAVAIALNIPIYAKMITREQLLSLDSHKNKNRKPKI